MRKKPKKVACKICGAKIDPRGIFGHSKLHNSEPLPVARRMPKIVAMAAEAIEMLDLLQAIYFTGIHHFTDNNGWHPTLTVSMFEKVRKHALGHGYAHGS
jgi:hypothetical protein